MSDDQAALAGFCGITRLLPLPTLVLLPEVLQGLHIFEHRYRQMTADSLGADHLITTVLLKSGWDVDYDRSPAIEPVGCLCRITHSELLPDGRYNLRLRGLARLRLLDEVSSGKLYRTARAAIFSDSSPTDPTVLAGIRRQLRDLILARFGPETPARRYLEELFHGEMSLARLCDTLTYALPIPLELRQQLLAEPRSAVRAEILGHAMRPPTLPADRGFPPGFSLN